MPVFYWNTGRIFDRISLEERVHKRRVAYAKVHAFVENRRKADLTTIRALKGKLLSINFPGSGYIVLLDGDAGKLVISRDVVFNPITEIADPIPEPISDGLEPVLQLRETRMWRSSIPKSPRMQLQRGMSSKRHLLYLHQQFLGVHLASPVQREMIR